MKISEKKKVYIEFELEDRRIIHRLVREQVGDKTIAWILDNYSYVFEWYIGLFSVLRKIHSDRCIDLDYDEFNALSTLVSKAYNNPNETEKDAIKGIADAIDAQRNSWYQ